MKSKTLKELMATLEPVFEAMEKYLEDVSKEDLLKALEGHPSRGLALKVWEELHAKNS